MKNGRFMIMKPRLRLVKYDDIGALNEIAELIEETEIPDVVWNNMSELLDYFSGSVPDLIENCENFMIRY